MKMYRFFNWVIYPAVVLISTTILFSCSEPDPPVCDGSMLLVPENPALKGPWEVGSRTVKLAGLTTEVWYPAAAESHNGLQKYEYDIREHIPDDQIGKVTDPVIQHCDCYRDLPVDTDHGPYPVIIMVHGMAGFRSASAALCTHWAGRGFIVFSADNPGITLKDMLDNMFGAIIADQSADTKKIIRNVNRPSASLGFLQGRIDAGRIGVAGHSAGGSAIRSLGNEKGVRVVVPMASGGVNDGKYLLSSLTMGAENDAISSYSNQLEAYTSSSPQNHKRLVGIANSGHLAFTDICAIEKDKGGLLGIGEYYGLDFPSILVDLGTDGCQEGMLSPEEGWEIINYASTAVFEETLQCSDISTDSIQLIESMYPGKIADFKEDVER